MSRVLHDLSIRQQIVLVSVFTTLVGLAAVLVFILAAELQSAARMRQESAESLTRLAENHGNREAAFAQLQAQFSDAEIVDLTVLIAQINAWNRMGVGMHLPVAERPID